MSKLSLLTVGGLGYLLGSRAGRKPYEAFASRVERAASDPRVQRRVDQAKHLAGRKADQVARRDGAADTPSESSTAAAAPVSTSPPTADDSVGATGGRA